MSSVCIAYFGCGCFWTKEFLFGKMPGVRATRTGYMGGVTDHPTYHQVCKKDSGHAETVEVTYDEDLTSFSELLKGFFSFHDATRDRSNNGGQYRSVVFWRKQEEKEHLESIFEALREANLPVSTSIEKAGVFWEAEERHQGYVERTGHYCDVTPTMNLSALSLEDVVRKRTKTD